MKVTSNLTITPPASPAPSKELATVERAQPARPFLRKKRFFTAGSASPLAGFNVTDTSADGALHGNIERMMARSRDLARNNTYVKKYLDLLQTNIIGPDGFTFRPCLKTADGKSLIKSFNTELWKTWKKAGKIKNKPTMCGKMSLLDFRHLWIRTLAIDGEVIFIKHPNTRKNSFGFSRQMIDSARLDARLIDKAPNGNRIKMGVEVDEFDEPVAYYFLKNHPGELLFGESASEKHTRVPASVVSHKFIIERPGQTRGISWLAPTAMRVKMLDGFEEAVTVGARVAASKMGFYKLNREALEEGMSADELQDFNDECGDPVQNIEPGQFEQLPSYVDEVQAFDAGYPPAGFEEFEKRVLKSLSAGMGCDYAALTSDYGDSNYSSLRGAKMELVPFYRKLQRFVRENLEELDFEDWAGLQLLRKQDALDKAKLRRLLENEDYCFRGRGFGYTDPQKEQAANTQALANGTTSRSRIIEEHSDSSFEEIMEEQKYEKEMLEEAGLWVDPDPVAAKAPKALAK